MTVMQSFSDVYPHLRTATDVPTLVKIADVNWDDVDAAFCCLPHATTQETLAQLPKHIKIVDLSADFRLRNVDTYADWYGRSATLLRLSQHMHGTCSTICMTTSCACPLAAASAHALVHNNTYVFMGDHSDSPS